VYDAKLTMSKPPVYKEAAFRVGGCPDPGPGEEWRRVMIYAIVVGLIAGWLAGQVMKGGGYGVIMDIVLGILGGIVGSWLFGLLGLHAGGPIGSIIVSFVGAVLLVWISRKLKKA
jgi:uncharacterized membrane protein YeaQ/YmgE (transglycosylase-associated protein family)